ncbi:MAG: DUF1801 domain-containing protein [Myxococcales bacterium]|nr:DUF1801 domain-containing protein [Myxococcales bacterium]
MLSPDALLARYTPEVRDCVRRLRELIGSWVPEAQEQVYPGWKAIGYRSADAGYFCGLFPQDDHVLVGFERGSSLNDPKGLLERPKAGRVSGTLRYLRVSPAGDLGAGHGGIDTRVLAPLIIEAASQSSTSPTSSGSPSSKSPRPTRGAPR